jgi:hypothetical protein
MRDTMKIQSQPPTTTIRLGQDLDQELKVYLEDNNLKQVDFFRELVRKRLAEETGLPKRGLREYRSDLAEAVAAHIRTHTEWISETLLDMELLLEGTSIFARRTEHFRKEKIYLARQFIPWLLKRIFSYIDKGYKVYLVIDSGTSLYWVFRRLERDLTRIIQQDAAELKNPEMFVILTNNTAGANSYVSASNIEVSADARGSVLSEKVKCHVLGGQIVTRYAALLGPQTVSALENAKQQAIREGDGKVKFIGLLVGQWVRIAEDEPRQPIALARGFGQREFKLEMIRRCDETFLLSPLGKVFAMPYERIRDGLGADAAQRFYVDVAPEAKDNWTKEQCADFQEKSRGIRLVTTTRRTSKSILYSHSKMILGIYGTRIKNGAELEKLADTDFSALPQCFYEFDELENETEERQCEIEFPHVPEVPMNFMREAFSVTDNVAPNWNGPKRAR